MLLEIYITDNLNLLRMGGAATGNSLLLSRKFFNSVNIKGKSRDIVVISKYLKEGLTELEYKAIYYHEMGHYVNNHNDKALCKLNWKEKELEADRHAIRMVGPEVLLNAFIKIPLIIKNCMPLRIAGTTNKTQLEYTDKLNKFLDNINTSMEFRYDVLRSLCKK